MKFRVSALVGFLFFLASTSCSDFFVSPNALDHINISPQTVILKVADTLQLTATAVKVDGSSFDVTQSATWTTANNGTATVNSTGMLSALGSGNTTVQASQSNVNGTGIVIVRTVGLQSTNGIVVTAPNSQLANGSTMQMTATANFTDGATLDITNGAVWSSSATGVATVSTTGQVKGVAAGSATITATVNTASGAVSGSFSVTVF